jgi:hypothetical protein
MTMKEDKMKELSEQALKHLSSEAGKKELQQAADKSRQATDSIRRAREIDAEHLNQRFTV